MDTTGEGDSFTSALAMGLLTPIIHAFFYKMEY